MSKPKVLYICHNHPTLYPGGAEAYALELYETMSTLDEFEPIFLARIGSDMATERRPHPGTPFSAINRDGNQYFFYTETADFDSFYMTLRNKDTYYIDFDAFLTAHQPDVVHFQHTHYLGYDLIRQTRNTLPKVPIVYTLHEYHPICHHHGQMVRTRNLELCSESSPRRCHECFPAISPQSFFMRQRFIQSHFSLVDLFLAPSRFLLERYVDWGIPREKIQYEDNGRRVVRRLVESEEGRPRNRLGFFGQFNPFKGVDVLLKAMKILNEDKDEPRTKSSQRNSYKRDIHLWLYGGNLELQAETFKDEVNSLLGATKQNVTVRGRYDPSDLPRLMASIDWVIIPSTWWENAPLVIQEAFQHGRPVICSDIGGMAEKVADGVNGLHFHVRDPLSLAQTIRRAVSSSPGLWETLHSGIPEVYKIEDHAAALTETYRILLDRKT